MFGWSWVVLSILGHPWSWTLKYKILKAGRLLRRWRCNLKVATGNHSEVTKRYKRSWKKCLSQWNLSLVPLKFRFILFVLTSDGSTGWCCPNEPETLKKPGWEEFVQIKLGFCISYAASGNFPTCGYNIPPQDAPNILDILGVPMVSKLVDNKELKRQRNTCYTSDPKTFDYFLAHLQERPCWSMEGFPSNLWPVWKVMWRMSLWPMCLSIFLFVCN